MSDAIIITLIIVGSVVVLPITLLFIVLFRSFKTTTLKSQVRKLEERNDALSQRIINLQALERSDRETQKLFDTFKDAEISELKQRIEELSVETDKQKLEIEWFRQNSGSTNGPGNEGPK